jgi:S-adenosylmethionine uptake transporter
MATWYYTLGVLPMGISVTLNYLSPLFLGLILFLFDRTSGRPSFKELAFVVLGFIGVVVLMNPFATTLNGNNIFPIVLGTLAAIVSALAFKDVRVLKNSGQNEWQMVFYFSAMGTVLSFPFTSFARLDPSGDLTGIVALVLAGLFGALGQLGVSKAFGSGDQITAASFQYLSVVFSLLLSWAVLDETVSIVQLAGISIIVIAAIFTIAERSRRALHSVNR